MQDSVLPTNYPATLRSRPRLLRPEPPGWKESCDFPV